MTRDEIRSIPQTRCHVCGGAGATLHLGVEDRLFDAPGKWNVKRCANPECGLLWLDPMPLPEDLGKAYRTYYTHGDLPAAGTRLSRLVARARQGYRATRYGLRLHETSRLDRFLGQLLGILPMFRDGLGIELDGFADMRKGRLLEIGCGDGSALKVFAEWGWQVQGLDVDPEAVHAARGKGLDVRQGSIFEQRYADDSFDAIFFRHVIEHVPDPGALLIECRRILRPGGRLLAVTPNGRSLLHAIFRQHWRGLEPPRHLHIFTENALRRLSERADLRQTGVVAIPRGAGLTFVASRRLKKGIGGPLRRPAVVERLTIHAVNLLALPLAWLLPRRGEELVLRATK